MGSHTLIFYETGLNSKIPDLKDITAASFPVWGDYCFLDCAISNFLPSAETESILLLESVHRSIHSFAANRWKKQLPEIVMMSRGIENFLEIIEALDSDFLILSSLHSSLFLKETTF